MTARKAPAKTTAAAQRRRNGGKPVAAPKAAPVKQLSSVERLAKVEADLAQLRTEHDAIAGLLRQAIAAQVTQLLQSPDAQQAVMKQLLAQQGQS